MYAARYGYTKVVKTVLEHEASVDLKRKVSALQLQPRFKYLMCISVSGYCVVT